MSAGQVPRDPTLLPAERQRRISAELDARESVRVEELARRFAVSAETIRRDLLSLEDRGLARRVYGGAVRPASRTVEASFEERRISNLDRKQAIATLAASLLAGGETLIFDVGTSVAEVAKAVPQDFTGRVLTCSLLAATELADRDRIEVLTSGGRVRSGDLACSGPVAEAFFRGYFADKAFLGSGGVSAEAGLTDYYLDEIAVRRIVLAQARECYVLADSTKIGEVAVGRVCPLSALTGVITDSDADPEAVAAIRDAGTQVLVAAVDRRVATVVGGTHVAAQPAAEREDT